MEKLLHYTWQHKLFPLGQLHTSDGQVVEIVDPGLHNLNDGPDFFNAKIKIGGTLWVGNVEIHERSSDWFRHGHQNDSHYDNVVLHVARVIDQEVRTASGIQPPQMQIDVPEFVEQNYQELLEEETYPPCFRVIPYVHSMAIKSWLDVLTAERLEEKAQRIEKYLERTSGDWERAYFITLARNFGFGTNAEAFEEWAFHLPPQTIAKHRDDLFQVEAFFMGQAGLLSNELVPPAQQDDYFQRLQKEYRFMAHKFSLQPMDPKLWRFLRMRPQNFPHVRLSQLATLYHQQKSNLSHLLETTDLHLLRQLFAVSVTPYWESHYHFGVSSEKKKKRLQASSLDLIVINTAAPILFAHGKVHHNEENCQRALDLLEATKAERNFITQSWEKAGIKAEHSADSQALIQLKRAYCDRKNCLRCRFGTEYLKRKACKEGQWIKN